METYSVVMITFLVILFFFVIGFSMRRSSSECIKDGSYFPSGHNVKITNTSTKTFTSYLIANTKGNLYTMTDVSGQPVPFLPHQSIIVHLDSNETSISCMLVEEVNNLTINILAKVNHKSKIFSNGGTSSVSFHMTHDSVTARLTELSLPSSFLGTLHTKTTTNHVLKNHDPFPSSIYLWNSAPQPTDTQIWSNASITPLDISGYASETMLIDANQSTSALPLSFINGDYWIIIDLYSTTIGDLPILSGSVLYRHKGKAVIVTLGQPSPLVVASTQPLVSSISQQTSRESFVRRLRFGK